jgi:hypothetical protein
MQDRNVAGIDRIEDGLALPGNLPAPPAQRSGAPLHPSLPQQHDDRNLTALCPRHRLPAHDFSLRATYRRDQSDRQQNPTQPHSSDYTWARR